MTKKQLLARIEQLEQRIAVLEAQNAPLMPSVTRTEPITIWETNPIPRPWWSDPQCVGIAQSGATWSDNVAWYSGRDKEPS